MYQVLTILVCIICAYVDVEVEKMICRVIHSVLRFTAPIRAHLARKDVIAGASRPLLRPSRICPEIHGDSGLDGYE